VVGARGGEWSPGPGRPYEATAFEDLPGKWQAAILKAEKTRPKLRLISND